MATLLCIPTHQHSMNVLLPAASIASLNRERVAQHAKQHLTLGGGGGGCGRATGATAMVKLGAPAADELGYAKSLKVVEIGGSQVRPQNPKP